ncbi:MAG TPA: DUF885 family protein, partial [Pyrinomonadaceae bacterium]|nr:DUF885 family protein [Pyrinomonadaceae bacterium]
HTAGMSYEQGVEFFMRESYMERTNAEREARRGTADPTYLVYTLGKMEIMRLRADYERRMGAGFRLGEFHDRLLSYGMPPIKILRLALLGDAAEEGAGAATGAAAEDQTRAVDFSVLATGTISGLEGGRVVELITNAADWQRVWNVIGGRVAPDVNFTTQAVVVVFEGRHPTGGYAVSISGIRRDGTVLAVSVDERRPASGDITMHAVTSPFMAVTIPRPAAGTTVRLAETAGAGAVEQQPRAPRRRPVYGRRRRRY